MKHLPEDRPGHRISALSGLVSELTPRGFPEREVREHWDALLEHWRRMCSLLDRDPGLRVAFLDFFQNLHSRIRNPGFVEREFLDRLAPAPGREADGRMVPGGEFPEAVRREVERSVRFGHEVSLLLVRWDPPVSAPSREVPARQWESRGSVPRWLPPTLRASDVASRTDEGEFLLLLPETDRMGAARLGERIRRLAHTESARPVQSPGFENRRLSGGISTFPEDGNTSVELLVRAGEAAAVARDRGGDTIVLFHREKRLEDRWPLSGEEVGILPVGAAGYPAGRARARNLSRSGLLLEAPVPCRVGEEIDVRIPAGRWERGEGPVRGKVVRSVPFPGRRFSYEVAVAVSFPDDRERLGGWLAAVAGIGGPVRLPGSRGAP